ncbi:hypothetical protein [Costertonia aggregata]|uniref:Uncharacterized protein n=1 Tax=Costertonia aggregata TaxID=343403 RepID=A0A7H9ALF0_9FLAO|nr:hypothetical protein [Costertonia aggregata]QLG44286.1 hypothetical protein HYG79_02645 [Costertonia aggregata]
MELKQQLVFCKQCEKREFNNNTGIVCSLTQRKPDFTESCSGFVIDPKQAQKVAAKSYEVEKENSSNVSIWSILVGVFILIRIVMRFMND